MVIFAWIFKRDIMTDKMSWWTNQCICLCYSCTCCCSRSFLCRSVSVRIDLRARTMFEMCLACQIAMCMVHCICVRSVNMTEHACKLYAILIWLLFFMFQQPLQRNNNGNIIKYFILLLKFYMYSFLLMQCGGHHRGITNRNRAVQIMP